VDEELEEARVPGATSRIEQFGDLIRGTTRSSTLGHRGAGCGGTVRTPLR
jgi:hypothetical protein